MIDAIIVVGALIGGFLSVAVTAYTLGKRRSVITQTNKPITIDAENTNTMKCYFDVHGNMIDENVRNELFAIMSETSDIITANRLSRFLDEWRLE